MSTDVRGNAIERSQNRQRKLNGIITWYFDHVMEALPLMLQAALLLLGGALSRYLWEIDTIVASVALGVTSLGIAFFLFIVLAGSVSAGCPYQTPGSRILRSVTTSAFRETIHMIQSNAQYYWPWWSRDKIGGFFGDLVVELPPALVADGSHLGRAMVQPLVTFAHEVCTWLSGTPHTPADGLDQQTTLLDLDCISWILQASLDRDHHLSALEYLGTMVALSNFDPALVVGCFSVFTSCVKVSNGNLVVAQGLEQLAIVSAIGLLQTFSCLSVIDLASSILTDVRQHYARIFPYIIDLDGLPSYHIFGVIHFILCQSWRDEHLLQYWDIRRWIKWRDYKPSSQEYILFTHSLAKLAQSEYQRRDRDKKVPRWILKFAFHSLSLDSLPSNSVTAGCLSIIAIDLNCDVLDTKAATQDERYVHT